MQSLEVWATTLRQSMRKEPSVPRLTDCDLERLHQETTLVDTLKVGREETLSFPYYCFTWYPF